MARHLLNHFEKLSNIQFVSQTESELIYNRSLKSCLKDQNIKIYSTYATGKSEVTK